MRVLCRFLYKIKVKWTLVLDKDTVEDKSVSVLCGIKEQVKRKEALPSSRKASK